jgi:F0F1-type ATP synthase delta subunit
MLAEAKKESDRIVDQAHKNEERLRQKIAQEMEEKTVTHAAEIFKAVFSARVNQQVNREFNEELVAAFEALDGESITIDADEGEIRTSQPMEAEQKKRLEELLVRKFHRPVRLVERIDPDLLSGLVLKLGSLEIDGSLRNRLEEAVQEVTKGASAA